MEKSTMFFRLKFSRSIYYFFYSDNLVGIRDTDTSVQYEVR